MTISTLPWSRDCESERVDGCWSSEEGEGSVRGEGQNQRRAQIHKLANYFAQKGVMLPRALSEIYENIRDFFVIRDGDKVVGVRGPACVLV